MNSVWKRNRHGVLMYNARPLLFLRIGLLVIYFSKKKPLWQTLSYKHFRKEFICGGSDFYVHVFDSTTGKESREGMHILDLVMNLIFIPCRMPQRSPWTSALYAVFTRWGDLRIWVGYPFKYFWRNILDQKTEPFAFGREPLVLHTDYGLAW